MEIALGRGLARPFGQVIARKLGIPLQPDPHTPRVEIGHQPDCLLWNRRFGARQRFRPVRAWPDGLWLEQTGLLRQGLVVEVVDGACVLALPQGLVPWSQAAAGAVSAIHCLLNASKMGDIDSR